MITVPKSAFGSQAEGGEPITPEVGDEVNLGEVVMRINADRGENYDCDVVSVNGTAVGDGASEMEEGVTPSDTAGLKARMEAEDEE